MQTEVKREDKTGDNDLSQVKELTVLKPDISSDSFTRETGDSLLIHPMLLTWMPRFYMLLIGSSVSQPSMSSLTTDFLVH